MRDLRRGRGARRVAPLPPVSAGLWRGPAPEGFPAVTDPRIRRARWSRTNTKMKTGPDDIRRVIIVKCPAWHPSARQRWGSGVACGLNVHHAGPHVGTWHRQDDIDETLEWRSSAE